MEPSEFKSQGARRGRAAKGRGRLEGAMAARDEDEEEEGAVASTIGASGEGAGVRQDDEEV